MSPHIFRWPLSRLSHEPLNRLLQYLSPVVALTTTPLDALKEPPLPVIVGVLVSPSQKLLVAMRKMDQNFAV